MDAITKGLKSCPKCSVDHNKVGTFCSRSCANSKKHTKETKEKIRNTLKGRRVGGGKLFYERGTLSDSHKLTIKQKALERGKASLLSMEFGNCNNEQAKKKLILEVGYKCEDCGYCKVDIKGRAPLQLHHVDGDNTNNERSNIQLLCMNCHYFTDNWSFKDRNHTEQTKDKYFRKAD